MLKPERFSCSQKIWLKWDPPVPKKKETWIPKNYRPIACLPTTFKILTSVITYRVYSHLEKEAIMMPEKRGGKKDCYGYKDQLMINNAILEN